MGALHCGSTAIAIDDETLALLSITIVTKIRRRESLLLTVFGPTSRISIWIHPATMLRFQHVATKAPVTDRVRLERMMRDANAPGGIAVEALSSPVDADASQHVTA